MLFQPVHPVLFISRQELLKELLRFRLAQANDIRCLASISKLYYTHMYRRGEEEVYGGKKGYRGEKRKERRKEGKEGFTWICAYFNLYKLPTCLFFAGGCENESSTRSSSRFGKNIVVNTIMY
ncbi:hypothetical protein I3843_11G119900 [Carya illinoinensis]|nr:hypothetical protein I3760_11G119600 [Carya illinoinensis]KAG7956355.1 hypothetical protein I3843_11G119900 [Carya illinoinensis]